MSQHYSDPTRENDTYALPDVEVFYAEDLPCEECANVEAHAPDCDERDDCACGKCDACNGTGHGKPGFYYWYCFPGCLPEGSPRGPYDTEEEAIEAMREDASC